MNVEIKDVPFGMSGLSEEEVGDLLSGVYGEDL
jgi:hypothetical protein